MLIRFEIKKQGQVFSFIKLIAKITFLQLICLLKLRIYIIFFISYNTFFYK